MKDNSKRSRKYSGKSNRSGKGRYSNKGEVKEEMEVKDSYPLKNDPNWYFDDATLADMVSSFSFNQFIGAQGGFINDSAYDQYALENFMRIALNPCPGWADQSAGFSGINQVGMKLYTMLSSGNSKNTVYAPQDVTTLLLALGEVLSVSEAARRALGLAFTYNKRNWTYAKDIIHLLGFDADDLLKNLAQYRIWFNTVVNQINKIAFPADIKYFEKCVMLYSGLYLDSESPMAQTFAFVPFSTWDIDETSYPQGTILKTIALFDSDTRTYLMSQYLQILETKINLILSSATFNYIYADVLRLYGESGLYTIPYVTEEYFVTPEYNPMMLLQLNNMTPIGRPSAAALDLTRGVTPNNDVYPDVNNNRLLYMPQFAEAFAANPDVWKEPIPLNFPHSMGNPDVTQRIESTRFVARLLCEVDSTGNLITGAALPDHYVVAFWTFKSNGTVAAGIASPYIFYDDTQASVPKSILDATDALTKFDRAPRLYCCKNVAPYSVTNIVGDIDYYTDIDYVYLNRVNQLAFLGLFSIRSSKR